MSTRTLVERMIARDRNLKNDAYTPYGHVRAELDRLARQVRKLNTSLGSFYGIDGQRVCIRRKEVLDLIKEARR